MPAKSWTHSHTYVRHTGQSQATMRDPGHFRFIGLLQELRFMIYERLSFRATHHTTRHDRCGIHGPIKLVSDSVPAMTILRTCCQANSKADTVLGRRPAVLKRARLQLISTTGYFQNEHIPVLHLITAKHGHKNTIRFKSSASSVRYYPSPIFATTHLHPIFATIPCTPSHESITLDTGTTSSTKHSYFSQSAVLLSSNAAAMQAILLNQDSH
jgi:hypothetical protein